MIKTIKRVTIFTIGVGAGFCAGYLRAGYDLDREAIRELADLGKEFFAEANAAVRTNVEETRKQTELFEATAAAMRKTGPVAHTEYTVPRAEEARKREVERQRREDEEAKAADEQPTEVPEEDDEPIRPEPDDTGPAKF